MLELTHSEKETIFACNNGSKPPEKCRYCLYWYGVKLGHYPNMVGSMPYGHIKAILKRGYLKPKSECAVPIQSERL